MCHSHANGEDIQLVQFLLRAMESWLRAHKQQEHLFRVTVGEQESRQVQNWLLTAWSPSAGNFKFKAVMCRVVQASPHDRAVALDTYGEPPGFQPGWVVFSQERINEHTAFDPEQQDPAVKSAFAEPFLSCSSLPGFAHHQWDEFVAALFRLVVPGEAFSVLLEPLHCLPIGFDFICSSSVAVAERIEVNLAAMAKQKKGNTVHAGFLTPCPPPQKKHRAGPDLAPMHDDGNDEKDELTAMLEQLIDEEEAKHFRRMGEARADFEQTHVADDVEEEDENEFAEADACT
jgi:hypothetical protein